MADDSPRRAALRFLEYYAEVRKMHQEQAGAALKEYKPTETDRLEVVFRELQARSSSGLEFLADVLHELVWGQCLGNANHRTTVLFLQAFLDKIGVRLPHYTGAPDADARFRDAVNQFSEQSHKLLDRQSEFGYNPDRLRLQHRTTSLVWLEKQLGPKSIVDASVGPQSLKDFLS